MYYADIFYILTIILFFISMICSGVVRSRFNRYSKDRTYNGMTGAMAAERILRANGITDVTIVQTAGALTDNYNPTNHTLTLSQPVYGGQNVSAVAVAAHECGHAIQHKEGYFPLKLRSLSVPVANIGSKLSWPIIFIGLILGYMGLARIGVFLFTFVVLFQLITLPVEFDASRRALKIMEEKKLLIGGELKGASKVLKAAALTYVASLLTSILQLLRLFLLTQGNGRRRR